MDRVPPCWHLDSMKQKRVIIKLSGGKEISGVLKNSDAVGNLVLSDTVITCPGPSIPPDFKPRALGAAVIRAPHISSINVE